jgi:hypothetical protein
MMLLEKNLILKWNLAKNPQLTLDSGVDKFEFVFDFNGIFR